ncbi:MAG: hypothetical protein JO112_08865, partial [Planctomycetes bacterium]|nr:hypothetical protein [Planctomycetota bacterium]
NNPPSGSVGFLTVTVTDPSGNNVSTGSLLAPEGSQVSVQVGIPTSSINWNSSFFLTKGMVESETVVMMKQ